MNITCADCDGRKQHDCPDCEGEGDVTVRIRPVRYNSTDPSEGCEEMTCPRCHGERTLECETCGGAGSYQDPDEEALPETCQQRLPEVA